MLIESDVPENILDGKPVIVGIDEAGRGPVLGPMVYGASYWAMEDDEEISQMGFDDSKALSVETRETLFEKMKDVKKLGYPFFLCI
jgi:ribonuclease H2 subunit A